MKRMLVTTFALLVALAGCVAPEGSPTGNTSWNAERMEKALHLTGTPQKVSALLRNTTTRIWDKGHGTQVEYLSAGGKAFLWYPGNRSVVVGDWKTQAREGGSVSEICFRYGQESYNPVTGQSGGTWSCRNATGYLVNLDVIVRGDPFNLTSGRVPYVLPKQERISLGKLFQRAGRAPVLTYVWPAPGRGASANQNGQPGHSRSNGSDRNGG